MRLGGPTFGDKSDPEKWISELKELGYSATYCPLDASASDDKVKAFADAAAAADIVIAEVGAWSNPISPDDNIRKEAVDKCKSQLALAERIGANCCVNITGSRGSKWDGPSPEDLTKDTFDLIVATTREIIDAVKPTRTFYTLETMPWMYPDSADSYLALLKAIDRKACAVHFDPANLVNCPSRYFDTGAMIREFCAKLGPQIRSCHGKDVDMADGFITHISEVQPGKGTLDYSVFLTEVEKLGQDIPVMLEHLKKPEEYAEAAAYVREQAAAVSVAIKRSR